MPRRKYVLNPQNTLAVLIGIDEYNDFEQVDPAPNNVAELANVLADEQIVGIPRERIKTIVGGRSTEVKEKLFDISEEFSGKGIETLILYFVGHGYRRPNGDYYLAAEDSTKRLLRLDGSTGIAYKTIQQIVRKSGIPQRLIFLDACYSGSTTLSGDGGMADMELQGTYTITSSNSREVSYFNPEHSHTLFTGELLNLLKQGLVDGGERIGLDELYNALKRAVRKRNPKMSPQQLGSQEITGGNYLFCKNLQYNAQTEQKAEVVNAIGLGDEFLKTKDLQQAEHQYLKARHLADQYGLLSGYEAEIQTKIKKLRYAEELHGEWNSPEKPIEGTSPVASKRSRQTFFKSPLGFASIGLFLLVAVLGIVFVSRGIEGKEKASSRTMVASDSAELALKALSDRDSSGGSGAEIIEMIGTNMVPVNGGTFSMGCTFEQGDDCFDDEKHLNKVTVESFRLNRFEVTQEEWRAVMGSVPEELRFPGCDRCPVEKISWREAKAFITTLNEMTGRKYRFPCESEWEYAARGGEKSKEFKYAGSSMLEKVAWSIENSGEETHLVGKLSPNELGLFDMSGNVYEWCQDHYHDSYAGAPLNGDAWEHPDSVRRVLRGGSWDHPAQRCRVSNRSFWSPAKRYKDVGLRLAEDL